MKPFYLLKLVVIAAALTMGFSSSAQYSASTLSLTGTIRPYVVPLGVYSMTVDVRGAQGGMNYYGSSPGGSGGRVQCTLAVVPQQTIYFVVGGTGASGTTSGIPGGYNGGGASGTNSYGPASGGGASDIRIGGSLIANRVVVAGGGGGAGYNCGGTNNEIGGHGGDLTGGIGSICNSVGLCQGGGGGSQSNGGLGATCYPGNTQDGTQIIGGKGYGGGGGGGGGYWCGGGGGWGGGGGGSSYTDPTLCTSVVGTQGYNNSGNGSITFTPICTVPTNGGGVVSGPTLICGSGIVLPYTTTASPNGVWSSTNTAVATVTNLGAVTSAAVGTTVISYYVNYGACGTALATTTVTVAAPPPPNTGTPTVCVGSTTTLSNSPGTWTSSNTFIATVGFTNGIVTGISPGTCVITYTNATGCTSLTTVTVNPTPVGIGGPSSVCQLACATLTNSSPGGIWESGNTSIATIGSLTGVVCNGSGTTGAVNISYTYPSTGCRAIKSFVVNALPTAYSVGGGGPRCVTDPGVDITLGSSVSGTNYTLWNTSLGTVAGSVAGTGSPINFGSFTAAGVYTVSATSPGTGCSNSMLGNATIVINPLPVICTLSVTGTGAFCSGSAGEHLILGPATEVSTTYILKKDGVSIGIPFSGTGSAIDLGLFTASGTYTVEGFTGAGCTAVMYGAPVITQNPLPVQFTVTGGGAYCSGDVGIRVGTDFSSPGIDYQLWRQNGGTPVLVSTLLGASASLDFGYQTIPDMYSVIAVNTATGCTNNQLGTATVVENPLPNVYTTGGGGNYCAGDTGVIVTLNNSDFGFRYQLYTAGSPIDFPIDGGYGALDFGGQTTAGTYTILSTNLSTGCARYMSGSVNVNINPLPAIFSVSIPGGASSYCAGDAGLHVVTGGSAIGINYQLYNDGSALGSPMAGTGSSLDFGLQTLAGVYTVVATNTGTNCASNMTGSPSITVNPLPAAFNITGGGNYCVGGAGVNVGVDFSTPGTLYQLYNLSSPVGTPISGLGSSIDFGLQTAPGSYTVIATNTATGCSNTMTGIANIVIATPPATFAVTGGGSYCQGGLGLHMGVSGSTSGIFYQLMNSGLPIGLPVSGTGGPIDMGVQSTPGIYTVVATDGGTSCMSTMSGIASITVNPLPIPYTMTGGGTYCASGTGTPVGLSGSNTGIDYQLHLNGTPVGSPVHGTGSALAFGMMTGGGNYTVVAQNVTTTCVNTMTGLSNIVVNPLPVVHNVTGGGYYCTGGAGVHVGVNSSDAGINYQLYNGATPVGSMLPGTGAALDFGLLTAPGTYSVKGTVAASGCSVNMSGTPAITTVALPTAYTVTGGGTFCEGTPGIHVGLTGTSAGGINYQLYNNGVPVGSPVAGTGGIYDFGEQTSGGTYTVVAINGTTTCTTNMMSSAVIVMNPHPTPYMTIGGGTFCSSDAGVNVSLDASDMGVNYQLYVGGVSTGLPIGGTGIALNFGLQRTGGTYTIVGTNTTTGCSYTMSGSPLVTVIPALVPSVTLSSGADDSACIGAISTITPMYVNGGSSPAFEWFLNGVSQGVSPSYSYVAAAGDVVYAKMTTSESCVSTPSVNSNLLTLNLIEYQLPSAAVTANNSNIVCTGTPVTYTASTMYGGTAPTYNWLLNNTIVASGTTYMHTPLNNDIVTFMLTSNYRCRHTDTVFSDPIEMKVDVATAPTFTFVNRMGPIIGVGQIDTLIVTVTNPSSSTSYQWKLNGSPVYGATNRIYVSQLLFDNDSVSVEVSNTGACGVFTNDTSVVIRLRNVGVKPVTTSASDIRVMPNPNKGAFVIKGSLGGNINEEVSIEISNMLGQVVYSNKAMAQNGNIEANVQMDKSLANGTYVLRVVSGTERMVFHVVIEQ